MNVQTVANRIRTAIVGAAFGVLVYAAIVSAAHIIHVAQTIGVPGWQAKTAWILVDLPALVGKLLGIKLPRYGYVFVASTRKYGVKLTVFSGLISLACNITSGLIHGSLGAAGWGAFVVMMFLVMEVTITKIKFATKANKDDAPAKPVVKTLTPAQRGAATRKRNAELRKLEAAYAADSE